MLAWNQAKQVLARLASLGEEVARQPAAFKLEWQFYSMRRLIGQDEKLSPYRAWLEQLFDVLAGKDRDTVGKALEAAQVSFKQ